MNVPADPRLWERIQRLVRGDVATLRHAGHVVLGPNGGTGFKKHPSAYSNGYAARLYHELGGTWLGPQRGRSLRTWFEEEDWVALDTRGAIVGPCAQSAKRPRATRGGQDPMKCLPRAVAESMTARERATAARRKARLERESPDTKRPARARTR